eukprot:1010103_1
MMKEFIELLLISWRNSLRTQKKLKLRFSFGLLAIVSFGTKRAFMCQSIHCALLLLCYCIIYGCSSSIINCTGHQKCYRQTQTCPNDEDCIIHCDGPSACAFSTIVCPQNKNATCAVTCNDYLSCNNLFLHAESTTSLSITSHGTQSLSHSHIYCPDTTLHNSCTIAHSGSADGFNLMSIYTLHNYNDATTLECDSNTCWLESNNPTLRSGDSMYSQTCTLYHLNDCISSSVPLSSTEYPDHFQAKTEPKGFKFTLEFFAIGMLCGMIGLVIVVACPFSVRYLYKKKFGPRRADDNNGTDTQTPRQSSATLTPGRCTPRGVKRALSPSLMELSPVLTNVIVEEKVENNPNLFQFDLNAMQRYQMPIANDKGEESRSGTLNSPFSVSRQGHVGLSSEACIVIAGDLTNGVAPDEFVIGSD